MNVKVVQDVFGHKNVPAMLGIYTDVTKELARMEFDDMDENMKRNLGTVKIG